MMFSSLSRGRRRRSGSVLVLTALSVVVLLGCVALSVDYGSMVMDANRLQRGCDAAALAGATKLKRFSGVSTGSTTINSANALADRSAASIEAYNVAWKNDNVPVDASKGDIIFSDNDSAITVRSTVTRRFFFAPVLGIKNGKVTRQATAKIEPITSMTTGKGKAIRVAPIGISWDTYNAYRNDQLVSHDIGLVRQNKTTFGLNDLVLFDLRNMNGKSGAKMQDQLMGVADETSAIGDYETTLNAAAPAETQKLKDGLDALFSQAAGAPWYDTSTDNDDADDVLSGALGRSNPRVVYLIITPSTSNPRNGTFDTQVQGFVPVYLDSYSENGIVKNGKGKGGGNLADTGLSIKMRFLPGSIVSDTTTPTEGNSTTSYSGLNSISLVG